MRTNKLSLALLSSVCWLTFGVSQAAAQGADAELEEVVVTALKQGVTVIETPATVDVVAPTELTQRNITSVMAIASLSPGVVLSNGVGGSASVSFRGLGSNNAIFNIEPSVAQFSDGIYLGHARDFNSPLYDVDHIEFVRGTQSTLLGKNVTLGAVSIVNNNPIQDFDWKASVTAAEDGLGDNVQGMINLPLSDKVQLRVSGIVRQDDGYYAAPIAGGAEPQTNEQSIRAKLAFQPAEGFDGVLMVQHDHLEQDGQGIQLLTDPNGTASNWIFRSSGVVVPLSPGVTQGGLPTRFAPERTVYSGSSPALGVPSIGPANGPYPFEDSDSDRVNLVLNYQLGDFKITSQTAYTAYDKTGATDLDFSAAALLQFLDTEKSKSFQQELRLSSEAFGGRFKYLAGFFYYTNDWKYNRLLIAPTTNTVGFPLTGFTNNTTLVTTDTWSVFASGVAELTDQIKIDAGLRYTHEEKGGNVARTSGGTLAGAFPPIPFTTYATLEADPVDYNLALRYQPTDWANLYLSYGKASKSGGFQDQPTFAATSPYAPEEAKSIEAGAKLELGRGTLSGAIYKTEIDGFQINYTSAFSGVNATFVGNAQIETKGWELAADYAILPNLKVNGEIVYADATFQEAFRTLTRAGDKLTRAPEYSAKVGVDFEHALNDRLTLFANANVQYVSEYYFQYLRFMPTAPIIPETTTVDAGVGLRGDDGRWEVALQGTNLTDEVFPTFVTGVSGAAGAYYGSYNPPRIVTLRVTLKH